MEAKIVAWFFAPIIFVIIIWLIYLTKEIKNAWYENFSDKMDSDNLTLKQTADLGLRIMEINKKIEKIEKELEKWTQDTQNKQSQG